jgi:hypothetical protein
VVNITPVDKPCCTLNFGECKISDNHAALTNIAVIVELYDVDYEYSWRPRCLLSIPATVYFSWDVQSFTEVIRG